MTRPPALNCHFGDSPGSRVDCAFVGLERHPQLPLVVRREFFQGGTHHGPHRHVDFFALYVIRGGRGVHRIDGTPYGLARGDVYLLAPGSMHEYLDYRDLVIDGFYFPFDLLEPREVEALRELQGFWRLFVTGGEANIERRLHLTPARHQEIESEIEELRVEYLREEQAAIYLLRTGFFRLLIELARLHAGELGEAERAKNEVSQALGKHPPFGRAMELAEVRRWCEQNQGEMPTVTQLASMMCLSPSQFRAVWKKETGAAPSVYLQRLRLERARAQLNEGRYSMAQVARKLGFADAAHFSRAFRAVYGQSPREYVRGRE